MPYMLQRSSHLTGSNTGAGADTSLNVTYKLINTPNETDGKSLLIARLSLKPTLYRSETHMLRFILYLARAMEWVIISMMLGPRK